MSYLRKQREGAKKGSACEVVGERGQKEHNQHVSQTSFFFPLALFHPILSAFNHKSAGVRNPEPLA